MRLMCARWRTFLLLAVAVSVAAHPFGRPLSVAQLLNHSASAEVQAVICTSHGAVVIDEPLDAPQPSKQASPCLWCAVGTDCWKKLTAGAAVELGLLVPARRLQLRGPAVSSVLPTAVVDWPAHPARGPPPVAVV